MKMVKTFIKTQHQRVMPPEKGRKEKKMYKANQLALSLTKVTGGAGSQTASEHTGGPGKRCQDGIQYKAQHNPSPFLCFSVVSLKI